MNFVGKVILRRIKNSMQELWLGDCLELMKKIPDKSIDLILTDPPYGVSASKWDKIVDFNLLWNQFNRIVKNSNTICIFGSQPFTTKLIFSNIEEFKYCWYWIKNQGTNFFHAKRMPIRKIEEVCVFGNGRYYPQITDGHVPTNSAFGCSNGEVYYGNNKRNYIGGKTTRFPSNILEFKCVDNYSRMHPNQKPLSLCEYFIKTYTLEDQIILDPFTGSGTTCLAAKNLNRQFIGIEKEEKYFNIAEKRIFND